MTEAAIGYDSAFEIGDGATPTEGWDAVAEVFGITPPNWSRDTTEATHYKSPDKTREYIETLADPGECSIELNFVAGGEADDVLQGLKAAGKKHLRVVFPNGAKWTFYGILTGYEVELPIDDRQTATATFKVTSSTVVS